MVFSLKEVRLAGWTWAGGMTGEAFSMGGIGAQGDLAGGAGLVEDVGGLSSLDPFAETLAVLACLSALAPSLRTVGLGPIDVTGLGIFFGASLAAGGCSIGENGSLLSVVVFGAVGCEIGGGGSG